MHETVIHVANANPIEVRQINVAALYELVINVNCKREALQTRRTKNGGAHRQDRQVTDLAYFQTF